MSIYARTMIEWSRVAGVSVALLFTDISAAFYSVVTEEALGELLQSPVRNMVLAKLGFPAEEIERFEAAL